MSHAIFKNDSLPSEDLGTSNDLLKFKGMYACVCACVCTCVNSYGVQIFGTMKGGFREFSGIFCKKENTALLPGKKSSLTSEKLTNSHQILINNVMCIYFGVHVYICDVSRKNTCVCVYMCECVCV